jgi:hypothetical protein
LFKWKYPADGKENGRKCPAIVLLSIPTATLKQKVSVLK